MGAGEVGRHLARSLSANGQRVALIDSNPEKQILVDEALDVAFVLGHGFEYRPWPRWSGPDRELRVLRGLAESRDGHSDVARPTRVFRSRGARTSAILAGMIQGELDLGNRKIESASESLLQKHPHPNPDFDPSRPTHFEESIDSGVERYGPSRYCMAGRARPQLVLSGTPGPAPSGLQPAGFHDKPVLFREIGSPTTTRARSGVGNISTHNFECPALLRPGDRCSRGADEAPA